MTRYPLAAGAVVLILTGCSMSAVSSRPAQPGSLNGGQVHVQHHVVQNRLHGKRWIVLDNICLGPGCTGIAVDSGGNVWSADPNEDVVYRTTMQGVSTQLQLPPMFFPSQLTLGNDGDLYVSGDGANYIAKITATGSVSELPMPSGDVTLSSGIVTGSSAVWFVEAGHVGKATADGTVTEFAYPSGSRTNNGAGITVGPDRRIWFVDQEAQTLGVVDQHTNTIVELPSGTMSSCAPYDIASAEGFLWVGCGSAAPELARVSTHAAITYYQLPIRVGQTPQSMAVGPNGDLWMSSTSPAAISDFNVQASSLTSYLAPDIVNLTGALTLAPDGNFWMTGDNELSVFLFEIIRIKPNKVVLSGPGATATVNVREAGTTSWTATSSDPSIATIAPGGAGSQFVITAVAQGSCTMTIADSIGNSAPVSVTVQ